MPQATNRLIHETSPYLVQHANNPVDWYPWGEEALRRAREEDKPILLSIGYAACHWCHVMAHESFEDEETARLMNERFVNVKVDREERPDLDAVYMEAVQAMTGHGGWPMTVFLTSDGVPFYGGTYFPPEDRHGLPSFRRLLTAVAEAWRERRGEIQGTVDRMSQALGRMHQLRPDQGGLDAEILRRAAEGLWARYDDQYGGFGQAPKFPTTTALEFLLRWHLRSGERRALVMVETTLERMARGGIYDQLGGGFHRYAVDRQWLVPHFEKMLYDNALLPRVYLHAHQLTGREEFLGVVHETLAWLEREMLAPEGAFYSTLDADSEGQEGKVYVWTLDEVRRALPPEEAEAVVAYYGLTPQGNFEGRSIPFRPRRLEEAAASLEWSPDQLRGRLESARPKLLREREGRIRPGRDEKILTSWNGLLIATLAEAGSALDQPHYVEMAGAAARFVLQTMRTEEGRLLHSYKDGRARQLGFLEDYAYLAEGLLRLYEATFDPAWLRQARRLVEHLLHLFWDEENGGFFTTSGEHEPLVSRPKDLVDSATPGGNAVAAEALLRLSLFVGEPEYERRAVQILRLVRRGMIDQAVAFAASLCALDFHLGQPHEVAIVGDPAARDTRALLRTVFDRYLPNKVVTLKEPGDQAIAREIPLLEGREPLDSAATAYVCQNYVCEMPVTDEAALARQLYGGD